MHNIFSGEGSVYESDFCLSPVKLISVSAGGSTL